MPYTDLLRVSVFLTAGEATALAAIAALAAGRDDEPDVTLIVAAAWWLVALVDRPLPRPRRRAPPTASATRSPGAHRDQPAAGDAGPDRPRPALADRRHRASPPACSGSSSRRGDGRRRLRAARRARLALARGRGARRRAARRDEILRRAQQRPAAGGAGAERPGCAATGCTRPPRRYFFISFLNSRQPRVLATSAAVSQARRAVATA